MILFKRKATGFFAVLLMLMVALPNASYAQKKKSKKSKTKDKEEKLYEMVSNEPEDAKNLHISLSPFFFDLSLFNGAAGADLGAYYNYNNKFAVHGIYQYGLYYDNGSENVLSSYTSNTGVSASGNSPFRNLQLGGTYFFKSDLKDVTEKITVKSETSGNVTTNYYLPVPAKELNLYGARVGFHSLKSNISAGSSNSNIEFVARPKDGGTSRTYDYGDYSTMMGMNMINLGISRSKISDIVIEVTNLGEREVKHKSEIYLDFLYAPSIVYSDMIIQETNSNGDEQIIVANVNDSTARSRFGIRAGYNVYSTSVVGLSYGFEGGLRPGPGSSALNLLYMNVRIAVSLNAKL
ncbi:MAG: hypothetical protein ACXWW0_10220 [Bacteroidia bacterium]